VVKSAGMGRGLLIAMEGVDGSGKTTQARMLAEALARRGFNVVLTQEPTRGPHGQKLRDYLAGTARHLTPKAELELFIADRRDHVRLVLGPALAAGRLVITDRYYYSSAAYQGALGLDPQEILAQNEAFAPWPHLVFLLRLPVSQSLARLAAKGAGARQLTEAAAYLERVAAIYESFSGPIFRPLDASQSPEVLHGLILREVLDLAENAG
jgi:dTMP kinase